MFQTDRHSCVGIMLFIVLVPSFFTLLKRERDQMFHEFNWCHHLFLPLGQESEHHIDHKVSSERRCIMIMPNPSCFIQYTLDTISRKLANVAIEPVGVLTLHFTVDYFILVYNIDLTSWVASYSLNILWCCHFISEPF